MGEDNKVIAIIPARFGSTRFPGKPLADICGKTMIQRVYEAVQATDVDEIVVATDNYRIIENVRGFGGKAVNTKPWHETGTDRVIEAYEEFKDDYRYVINVQGDEPTINVEDINSLINVIKDDPFKIATLVGSLEKDQMRDRNTVKAYIEDNEIKLFTRSPISTSSIWLKRHIGVYAFERKMLQKINKKVMIETSNEIVERLEQLRWLDNDIRFSYVVTLGRYKGIDTKEDLEKVKNHFLN